MLNDILTYQPHKLEEHINPMDDMRMFQTPQTIRKVIETVNKYAYNSNGHDEYTEIDDVVSVAKIVASEDDYITITFEKNDYWIDIKRTFRNDNNRRVSRKRRINWIIAHSRVLEECAEANVKILFR